MISTRGSSRRLPAAIGAMGALALIAGFLILRSNLSPEGSPSIAPPDVGEGSVPGDVQQGPRLSPAPAGPARPSARRVPSRKPAAVHASVAAARTADDLRGLLADPDIDWASCFDGIPVADVVRLLRAARGPYRPAGLVSLAAKAATSAEVLAAVASTSDGDEAAREGFSALSAGVPAAVRAGTITAEALAAIAVLGGRIPAGYDGVTKLLAWVLEVKGAADRAFWRTFSGALETASRGLGAWWGIRGNLVYALTWADPAHAVEFAEDAATWPMKEPYGSIRCMGRHLQDERLTEALLRRIPEYREPRLMALSLAALPPSVLWPQSRAPALARDALSSHVEEVLATPVDGEDGTREHAHRDWLLESWSFRGPVAATEALRLSLRDGLPHEEAGKEWRSDVSLRLLGMFRAHSSAVEPWMRRDAPFVEAERVLRDACSTAADRNTSEFVRSLHDQLGDGFGSWADARSLLQAALGDRIARLAPEARALLEK